MEYKLEDVKRKVERAIENLRKNDSFLITNNTNERSINHKLAEYLQEKFKEWHVDCEYNRDGHSIKRRAIIENGIVKTNDITQKTVFPDIIVHRRDTSENLLVIEMKKSNNRNIEDDIDKLKEFTQDPLNYKFGFFICFNIPYNEQSFYELEIYKEGKRYYYK